MLADSELAVPGTGAAQPLQVMDHAVRRLVPVVRFLLQQMQDDLRQRFRYVRIDVGRRGRQPGQVIVDEAQRVTDAERRLASAKFV